MKLDGCGSYDFGRCQLMMLFIDLEFLGTNLWPGRLAGLARGEEKIKKTVAI
jgi:hypothetical protein